MTDYLDRMPDYHNPAVASALDELSLWSARFGVVLLDHIPLTRGLTILDLGCGTGFPLLELAQMCGSSCHLVGVDVWREGLDRAARKRETYDLTNVTLVAFDGTTLPFAADYFDLIVSNLVLNNVEHPGALLTECARVAKPGAQLILTTNPRGHMREFYDVYREVLVELGDARYLDRLVADEDRRGTTESVRHLLKRAGFDITKVIEERTRLRYLDGGALLGHMLTRVGFLGGWREVVDAPDERAVFADLERRLNARARRQGALEMTVPLLYLEARRS